MGQVRLAMADDDLLTRPPFAVQLRFRPRDMGILDVMLHVSMENLVCLIDSGPRVYIAILLLYAAIILCRCLFYSASKGGCHFEKDKEDDLPLVKCDQATNNTNSIQVSGDDKSIRQVFHTTIRHRGSSLCVRRGLPPHKKLQTAWPTLSQTC